MKGMLMILLGGIGFCAMAQSPSRHIDSLQHWLLNGEYQAEIHMLVPNTEAAAIRKQMRDSIRTKPDWFRNFIKEQDLEKDLPYHRNFGVTELEYNKFLELKGTKEYGLRGRAKLAVMPDSNNLSVRFKSVGQLVGINYVHIDYPSALVTIASPLADTVILKAPKVWESEKDDNLFDSPFHGYTWKFISNDFENGNGNAYQFDVLHLFKPDKIFIQITVQTGKDGKMNPPNIVPFSYVRTDSKPITVAPAEVPKPIKYKEDRP